MAQLQIPYYSMKTKFRLKRCLVFFCLLLIKFYCNRMNVEMHKTFQTFDSIYYFNTLFTKKLKSKVKLQ